MASRTENSDWVQWIEALVGASAVPARPPEHGCALLDARYYCGIDDQPDSLVPSRLAFHALDVSSGCKRIFNPECSFGTPDSIELSKQHFACENPSSNMIWVTEPATRSAMPYWLSTQTYNLLRRAQPGKMLPDRIPGARLCALTAAKIIVEQDHNHTATEKWSRDAENCRNQFRRNGYAPVGQLIPPFHLAALRRYYRYHLRRGDFRLGDSQSALRYVALNEPVATFFHHQLTARVSDIVGEPVKPSYCYFSSYAEGSVLEKHTDREQCEFSVSMCIDYSPEPEVATPWPLRLDIEGGQVLVFQALGDALLYRGRDIPHSRNRLRAGHSSTSIFFHFVRQDFAGPLC